MNYESPYNLAKDKIIMIMAGLMVGLLVAAFDYSIMATAMPKVINSLQGMEYYVWPFTIYMLTSTISIILFGKLSDIYGRKHVLIAGITTFVITSVMCGFATNMFELTLFRGLQGIGGGILLTLPFIVVGEIFSPRDRAKYMGILASVFGFADVLGPILGGVITDTFGWRWVFFINVPVGIAAVTIILYSLPNFKLDNVKKVIDYSGIITFTLTLSSLFLALTLAGDLNTYPLTLIAGFLVFSGIMLILFILTQKKAVEPILPLYLFKNPIFNVSAVESFLASALMFSGIIYVPLFAQDVLGINATNSGLLMIPMLFSLTMTSIITGQIISKTGKYKKLVIAEFIITGIGVVLLSSMTNNTPYYLLVAYSTVLGIGSGMAYIIFNVTVQNAFTLREIGIVTASVRFFRNIGTIVFVPIFGYIMNFTLGSSAVNLGKNQALVLSIQNIFLTAIILAFVGLIIAFFLKEIPLNEDMPRTHEEVSKEGLEKTK